ncbi:MAG: FAD-dependent thymidylate synthase [Firmicutes bacterium]|nr:FAD-dependent thymidylate synthase [Bacillota bacterium]
MADIYAISHVPPEVSAYGMAKYSRSNASLRDSLLELSQEKAARFLNTFYFAYGHASIADLAHIALAVEDLSLLAAMDVVNEPLWDGQERSTRYQDFSSRRYYTPAEAGPAFHARIAALYDLYDRLSEAAERWLNARFPAPPTMAPEAYRRTLKARAFDVARYALPLATLTSLGQITSARVLERQISRLLTSPWAEVREIAQGMKRAVTEAAPFHLAAEQAKRRGDPVPPDADAPVAPTLIKHAAPDAYRAARRAALAAVVRELFAGASPAEPAVQVFLPQDPLEDLAAGLLYEHAHLSYGAIVERLRALGPKLRDEILNEALALRGPHDAWPEAMRQRPLVVDTVIDLGAFRDLNRHRRLDKVVQDLDVCLGFEVPPEMDEMGLGDPVRSALAGYYAQLEDEPAALVGYLLPLAHRRRALFRLDWPQAAYLIELRSRSSGHFSYRRWANALYRALAERYPALARHIRVTPLEAYNPFER